MKKIFLMMCMMLLPCLSSFANEVLERQDLIPSEGIIDSIFSDVKNGQYQGTANGVLFIKRSNTSQTILDFQGTLANLKLIEDENEVYDVSTKYYTASTTSGKTSIEYRTYAGANELIIHLPNGSFQAGIIDGACDSVINGLKFAYHHEAGAEYLVMQVTKPIVLDNYWPLSEAGQVTGVDDPNYKQQTIQLMPDSVIVFAIKE